jgi:hypothetical protein
MNSEFSFSPICVYLRYLRAKVFLYSLIRVVLQRRIFAELRDYFLQWYGFRRRDADGCGRDDRAPGKVASDWGKKQFQHDLLAPRGTGARYWEEGRAGVKELRLKPSGVKPPTQTE